MKNILLFLLIILPGQLLAQETKKVTDNETNETYYVLKSDKKTRHGEYKMFGFGKKLLVSGFYKQGQRDSIWHCYYFNGTLSQKYNYNTGELLFYNLANTSEEVKYKLLNIDAVTDTSSYRPPIFVNGPGYILHLQAKNTRYPADAIRNGITGTVYVSFTIDKNGVASGFHVKKPLGYGIDEEAIRVMKQMPNDWLPAQLNDMPVDVEVSWPSRFAIR